MIFIRNARGVPPSTVSSGRSPGRSVRPRSLRCAFRPCGGATAAVVPGPPQSQVARQDARDSLHAFQEQVRTAQALLYARSNEPEELEEGAQICRAALERYQVLDNPSWQKLPAVAYLTGADQDRLQEDVAELLF